ncbi:MAG: lasso peptide biosynthesis B2 protein [Thermoleophilia bacterium]
MIVAHVRAAAWALVAARSVRRVLDEGGIEALAVPAPPALPAPAGRAVEVALRTSRATCLVSSAVRQRWLAEHGDRRDLVIGVVPPRAGFQAHAWLEGDPQPAGQEFREVMRVPAA